MNEWMERPHGVLGSCSTCMFQCFNLTPTPASVLQYFNSDADHWPVAQTPPELSTPPPRPHSLQKPVRRGGTNQVTCISNQIATNGGLLITAIPFVILQNDSQNAAKCYTCHDSCTIKNTTDWIHSPARHPSLEVRLFRDSNTRHSDHMVGSSSLTSLHPDAIQGPTNHFTDRHGCDPRNSGIKDTLIHTCGDKFLTSQTDCIYSIG